MAVSGSSRAVIQHSWLAARAIVCDVGPGIQPRQQQLHRRHIKAGADLAAILQLAIDPFGHAQRAKGRGMPGRKAFERISKTERMKDKGSKRAFIGRFKLSRIAFRELASQGMIPGVTKSSW